MATRTVTPYEGPVAQDEGPGASGYTSWFVTSYGEFDSLNSHIYVNIMWVENLGQRSATTHPTDIILQSMHAVYACIDAPKHPNVDKYGINGVLA